MGTRNLSLCKKNGQIKIAQYGQWDGYPSGQGATILKFCKNEYYMEKLKNMLDDIYNIDTLKGYSEKLNKMWRETPLPKEMKYHLECLGSRDIGGEIFENIVKLDRTMLPPEMNGKIYLWHYEDLDKTTNYCDLWIEYAYLINFDTNRLECYGYDRLLKTYSLKRLPTETRFIKELEEITENL